MLDSLVRVSRRVNYGHFVSFLSPHHPLPASGAVIRDTACCLMDERTTRPRAGSTKRGEFQKRSSAPRATLLAGPASGRATRHLSRTAPKLTNRRTQCRTRKHGRQGAQGYHWPQSVPSQQFQVLFNSLFKVLFIFPSRYLFAIGLSPLFSFRRNFPPN